MLRILVGVRVNVRVMVGSHARTHAGHQKHTKDDGVYAPVDVDGERRVGEYRVHG